MFIATYDNCQGQGSTLTEAFDELEMSYGDLLAIDECKFFEATPIKVVHEIKAVPVTTIRKATTTTKKGNN